MLRTCFTCMSPGVGLKVVRPRELSLTRLALEGFNSYAHTEEERDTSRTGIDPEGGRSTDCGGRTPVLLCDRWDFFTGCMYI